MKRSELETYLNKYVSIVLFDNDKIEGVLSKTNEKHENPNLRLKNYYFLDGDTHHNVFRCSHVKKLENQEEK